MMVVIIAAAVEGGATIMKVVRAVVAMAVVHPVRGNCG
jgi:hypothetical protein